MPAKNQKEELNRVAAESFSLTGIVKNWYAARWGTNADVVNLYKWAGENDLLITRFNPISESKCRVLMSPVSYPAFEVETMVGEEKKGFHVALLIDMFSVAAFEVEVGWEALEFERAFRLDGGKVVEISA